MINLGYALSVECFFCDGPKIHSLIFDVKGAYRGINSQQFPPQIVIKLIASLEIERTIFEPVLNDIERAALKTYFFLLS